MQSCAFTNSRFFFFLPFSIPPPSSLLSLPILYFTSVDADSDEADRKAPLPRGGPNTSTVSKLYNEHREQTMPSVVTNRRMKTMKNSKAVIEKVVAIAYERLQL